jgi:AcrR family transcriptional regulator
VSDYSVTESRYGPAVNSPDASTRDRLLDAALALFARQGYSATSVADIQEACGLSPGSGALYKHFPSKKALLQEATRRHVEQMGAVRDEYDRTRPSDTRSALRQGAEQIWASIDDNSQLLRVMFREPEALEDMIDELWSAVAANAYQRTAQALSTARDAGVSHVEDPEATSTVLLAALAYLPIVQLLIQRTPGKLDADRFREAWLRLAEGAFTGLPPT